MTLPRRLIFVAASALLLGGCFAFVSFDEDGGGAGGIGSTSAGGAGQGGAAQASAGSTSQGATTSSSSGGGCLGQACPVGPVVSELGEIEAVGSRVAFLRKTQAQAEVCVLQDGAGGPACSTVPDADGALALDSANTYVAPASQAEWFKCTSSSCSSLGSGLPMGVSGLALKMGAAPTLLAVRPGDSNIIQQPAAGGAFTDISSNLTGGARLRADQQNVLAVRPAVVNGNLAKWLALSAQFTTGANNSWSTVQLGAGGSGEVGQIALVGPATWLARVAYDAGGSRLFRETGTEIAEAATTGRAEGVGLDNKTAYLFGEGASAGAQVLKQCVPVDTPARMVCTTFDEVECAPTTTGDRASTGRIAVTDLNVYFGCEVGNGWQLYRMPKP